MCAAEAQFNTIVKENEIKLNEQRKSKHGGVSTKLRGFLKPTGWKPLTILFLFFSFQQFSGIYITLFYAVTWFQVNNNLPSQHCKSSIWSLYSMIIVITVIQEVGSGVDAYIASILVGVTRFLCSMVNTWLLRRYKRRLLCIISSLGMTLCMTVSGYYTYLIRNGDRSGYWVSFRDQTIHIYFNKVDEIDNYLWSCCLSACLSGSCPVSIALRLHIYGWYADYSMDHDSRIIPHWDPRNRAFH